MSRIGEHLPGLARRRGLPSIPGTSIPDLAAIPRTPEIVIPGKQSYGEATLEARMASRAAKVQGPIYADARWQHQQLMKQKMMRVDNNLGHDVVLQINDIEWTVSAGVTTQPRGIALAFEEHKNNLLKLRQLTTHGSIDHDRRATQRHTQRMLADVESIANQDTRI